VNDETKRPTLVTMFTALPVPPYIRFQRGTPGDPMLEQYHVRIAQPPEFDMDALMKKWMSTPAMREARAGGSGFARLSVKYFARFAVEYFGYALSPAEDELLARWATGDTGADFWVAVDAAGLYYVPDIPTKPKKRGRPRRGLAAVPQQTWPEFEAVVFGVVRDGRTPSTKGTLWLEVPGEVALTHKPPGSALSLRLGASAVDDPLKDYAPLVATSYEDLRGLLATHAGQRTAYLLNYALALAASNEPGHVTVSIDELVGVSGPRPRSEGERLQRRRETWEGLRLFAHIAVYGRRVSYENAGEMLRTAGPLIAFTERADEGQLSLDGAEPPREITYVAGPWLERLATADPGLLPYFGDVLALAQQSDRRASYVWEKAIAWALGQRLRVNAKDAKESRQGMDKDGAAKASKLQTRDFTRRDLLDYLNPEPHYADVLASPHPHRAVTYWDDAVALLKQHGVVGSGRGDYVEHGPAPWRKPKDWPKGKPFKPQGWQDAWLEQKFTIRPGPAGQALLQDVKASAKGHK
jgi:hypothetical protein